MNRYKLMSYLLVILGIIIIAGFGYMVYSYASNIINAIVDFITTNDYSKLQACGVNTPAAFNQVKADFATVILPFFYVGIPLILIVMSYLMFMAGFYFHRGKHEDDTKKHEELEREMVHKIVKKMETEKNPQSSMPSGKSVQTAQTDENETTESEEAEEEPEEEPPPKPTVKKKK